MVEAIDGPWTTRGAFEQQVDYSKPYTLLVSNVQIRYKRAHMLGEDLATTPTSPSINFQIQKLKN